MKKFIFINSIVLITIFTFVNAQCSQRGELCAASTQCTTRYCRNVRCINYGDSPDDVGPHPCASTTCPIGFACVLKQTLCPNAPCPPTANCVQRSC